MSYVNELVFKLQDMLLNHPEVSNPAMLVARGMEFIQKFPQLTGPEKKAALIKAFETIAAGKDGTANTNDDVIPAQTVKRIKDLLENDMIGHIIEVIIASAKGKFDLKKGVEKAKGCFASVAAFFKR
jgi:hypothetical protein